MKLKKRKAKIQPLVCSFCHEGVDEVAVLIKTPSAHIPAAYICEKCVVTCVDLIANKLKRRT